MLRWGRAVVITHVTQLMRSPSRAQIMDADRVILDDAGVPLEASVTVGTAHSNVVRTVAWVVDRSSSCAAPPSTPTSRAASHDLTDGCALAADLVQRQLVMFRDLPRLGGNSPQACCTVAQPIGIAHC